MNRMERGRHRAWYIALCGECGAVQDSDYTESHFSDTRPCPNAGKIWVRKHVEVVPKEHWEEACQRLEAMLDEGDSNARFQATLYLSKFETIGVSASTATGEAQDG